MEKVNSQNSFNPQVSGSAEMPESGGSGTSTSHPSNMEIKMLWNVEDFPGAGSSVCPKDTCFLQKEPNRSVTQMSDTVPSCQPADPEGAGISSSSRPQIKHRGKISRKDSRKDKSILELLPEGTPLSYIIQGQIMLEGSIQGGLILCQCCNAMISPSMFEKHAGFHSRKNPYMCIRTCNGKSLRQLSECMRFPREHDICSICQGGDGDLLPCGDCSRFYHNGCVDLSSALPGELDCESCIKMIVKRTELSGANANVARRALGADHSGEETTPMCKPSDVTCIDYMGACAICGSHVFRKSGFGDLTVMICDQCDKEYHVGCLRKQKIADLKGVPDDEWFCCEECSKIHSTIQKLIGDGEQRLPESVSGILKKKLEGHGSQPSPKIDITWRLMRGGTATPEEMVWLSASVDIFHDEFETIAISRGMDLVPNMVYGRKVEREYDFSGMHCVILMVNSVVVSTALIRIFGEEVAELPLVATKKDYQGKGYFRLLLFCIEHILSTLNVKDLILPAAKDAGSMWRNKFGFKKVDKDQLDHYKEFYRLMMFERTSVLHKLIPKL